MINIYIFSTSSFRQNIGYDLYILIFLHLLFDIAVPHIDVIFVNVIHLVLLFNVLQRLCLYSFQVIYSGAGVSLGFPWFSMVFHGGIITWIFMDLSIRGYSTRHMEFHGKSVAHNRMDFTWNHPMECAAFSRLNSIGLKSWCSARLQYYRIL